MQAILHAIDAGSLDAEIACVITDVEGATILDRAKSRGIPAHFVDGAPFRTKLDGEAEARVVEVLRHHQVELVVLAGFMRMVKSGLLDAFPRKIVNIHPSLLPAFPGLESWRQALEYGAKVAGCTVHFVDQGMDTGPIILQRTVPILDNDTAATLHARIQEQEHIAFPEALRRIESGHLHVKGRRVLGNDE